MNNKQFFWDFQHFWWNKNYIVVIFLFIVEFIKDKSENLHIFKFGKYTVFKVSIVSFWTFYLYNVDMK